MNHKSTHRNVIRLIIPVVLLVQSNAFAKAVLPVEPLILSLDTTMLVGQAGKALGSKAIPLTPKNTYNFSGKNSSIKKRLKRLSSLIPGKGQKIKAKIGKSSLVLNYTKSL